jgi:NAD(P) transhydrogenase subunit alpha
MFSSNLFALVAEFWNEEDKRFHMDAEDEIIRGCLITHNGKIVNQMIADHYARMNQDG